MTSDYKEVETRRVRATFGLDDEEVERYYGIFNKPVSHWPSPLREVALPVFEEDQSGSRRILDALIVLFIRTERRRRRTISTE